MIANKQLRLFGGLFCIFILISINFILIPLSITTAADVKNNEDSCQIYPTQHSIPRHVRVDKPTGSGPYNTDYIFTYIPRENQTFVPARIYYPESGNTVDPAGAPYTGIVFAPGAGGTETSYSSTLSQIASWGYIVTIVGTGGPCNQEVVDIQSYVLDYYEELNANSSSIFYNSIDNSGYGASGHSNGGWAAIAGAVADDRFQAVCPLAAAAGPSYGSGQANTLNMHVPLQLISGADDTTFLPSSDAYYSLANPIKSYFKIIGSGHGGPFHLEYLVSFFKYWLEEENEYSTFIYGESLWKDIDDGITEYTSDLGLNLDPDISSNNVYEDEIITFNADGNIIEPDPEDRVIEKYEWDFDFDGVYDWSSTEKNYTTYYFSENGEYTVRFKITDSWGLAAYKDFQIIVTNKKPISNAGADRISNEDEIVFFDASSSTDTESDLDSLLFYWDFGDYNYSDWDYLPTASHAFSEDGKYTVRLYVKDDDEALSVDTLQVTVYNIKPRAHLNASKTEVEIGETITFNGNLSWDTPSDIPELTYLWDFDDSDLSEDMITTHKYENEGKYTVTLTVEDNNGVTDSDYILITVVNSPPCCEAMKGITVNEDETIKFTGKGFDTEGDQDSLQYSWDLGLTGLRKTIWNSTADYMYSYSKAGIYTAVLRVKDDNGAIATDSVKITVVNVAPHAEFFAGTGKLREDEFEIFNADQSTDTPSDLRTLNYTWDFDDGSPPGYGMKPIHGYFKSGEYSVTLTVTDDDGESDTLTKKIKVLNQEPICLIRATETRVYTGYSITFTVDKVSDTESDLKNLTFTWDFGDKTSGKGPVVTHSYSEPGPYYVRLTVKDDDKAQYTSRIDIRVLEVKEPEIEEISDPTENNFMVPTLIIIIILFIILFLLIILYFKLPAKNNES